MCWCCCGPRTPNVHIGGSRRFKHHQNSTKRHPERQKERNGGGRRKKKREILGGPAGERGPASGGLAQGGPGESKPTTTTTTITTTTPTPREVEGGGQTRMWPRRVRFRRVGHRRVGPPLPGFRVWVCRVGGSSLNVGLWIFGVWAFCSENVAKTLKH